MSVQTRDETNMKIKLSRSQWEGIGKKAGWMKVSLELPGGGVKECKECGNKIRNDQKKCPKCGEPNPHYWKAYGE